MFTGIVADVGEVVGREETADGVRLRLAAEAALADLNPGASICVSGACLTVEDRGRTGDDHGRADAGRGRRGDGHGRTDDGHDDAEDARDGADGGREWVSVFLASETRDRTYLGDLAVGDLVNLEPGLPADGRLDGHVVQGHVDGTTTVEAVREVGDDWEFEFALPEGLEQYVVEKGFVALDGISLTVAGLDEAAGTFSVAIIPETYRRTTLSEKAPGDPVNVEVDVLAKYVERMLESGGYGGGE